jgi:glycosyltransferase involved in cell wall biosynthesis
VRRLVFLIRSLEAGGAERQLVLLATRLDKAVFAVTIVTYYPGGILERELQSVEGVSVISVNKRGRGDTVGFLVRLIRTVRALRPDIVHGYMWGANELAWGLGRLTGARVVWGLRASNVDFGHYDRASAMLFRVGAWLSRRADLVIVNSHAGYRHHVEAGYSPDRMIVIPNGIDVERFQFDAVGRRRLRAEWSLPADALVVGIAGRLDPMKGHDTFLRAAAIVHERDVRAHFVIVGAGSADARTTLERSITDAGLRSHVHWVGPRHDMPAVYSACDIAVSSSVFGEGFSNTIGEAMACGIPCVATDVGDAALIVADCGRVVPPGHADLLADAISELAASDLAELGKCARRRVATEYGTTALADRTTAAMLALIGTGGQPATS